MTPPQSGFAGRESITYPHPRDTRAAGEKNRKRDASTSLQQPPEAHSATETRVYPQPASRLLKNAP